MIALILAAQVVAAVPSPQPAAAETLNLYRTPERCRTVAQRIKRPTTGRTLQRLGELPRANLELAVLRTDRDGCPVPVIVREDVEGDGKAAKPGL